MRVYGSLLVLVAAAIAVPVAAAPPVKDAPKEEAAPLPHGTEKVATDIAAGVKKTLAKRGEKAVAVGEFTGPARVPANAGGAVIRHALVHALEAAGVTIDQKAALELKGDFLFRSDSGESVRVTARLVDGDGAEVESIRAESWCEPAVIANTYGLTAAGRVEMWSNGSSIVKPVGPDDLAAAREKPRVHLAGTEVRVQKESPYAVEILVKDAPDGAAKAVTPKEENGLAYVPIPRDRYYEVKVTNRSPHAAAITLTIDGLDQFTFSDVRDEKTGKPRYSNVVIAKGQSHAIRGWHRTNEKADSFVITSYAKSAAAEKLVSSAKTGTITVTFAAAWQKPEERPKDEYLAPTAGPATGRGESVKTELKEARYTTGEIREIVTVRYAK